MKNKLELIKAIEIEVNQIINFAESIPDGQIEIKKNDKWSIQENLVHLVKSAKPLNLALILPKFTFIPFGKPSHLLNYEDVISLYQEKLSQGAKASGPYVPNQRTNLLSKENVIGNFKIEYNHLIERLAKWSEDDLNRYRLPHPIIGKITMREMMFFTLYHLKHHYETMKSLPTI